MAPTNSFLCTVPTALVFAHELKHHSGIPLLLGDSVSFLCEKQVKYIVLESMLVFSAFRNIL
jgi:hypothetical protein